MATTQARPWMAVHGRQGVTAARVCCGAARGTAVRGSCVPRIASGSSPVTGGCRFSRCQDIELNPESLPLGLLCGGPGGPAPWPMTRFHWDFSASECRASGPSRARAVCARWRCGVATAPGPRRRPRDCPGRPRWPPLPGSVSAVSDGKARRTGPALEAMYQLNRWLIPTRRRRVPRPPRARSAAS